MIRQPQPAPILDLVDILADQIVAEYLREAARNDDDKTNTSAPDLARTGTDGE